MITSPHNPTLKTIKRLQRRRQRDRSGLFLAEGEDLIAAAEAAGFESEAKLVAGEDVTPELLDGASTLGSGTRVLAVYRQRWSVPGGDVSAYLEGVGDPGNVGTVMRAAHALCDGPVVLGPGCADPFSPKSVRASMGSLFARPPARAPLDEVPGTLVALDREGDVALPDLRSALGAGPVVLCLGAEREGLPDATLERAELRVRVPFRPNGPDSLNVAMTATVALYELAVDRPEADSATNRMAGSA